MKTIIVGCGRLGCGLARMLCLRGHDLTVIDNTPAAFEALGPTFSGKTITGVGFDREVLLGAGIEQADALAAVTTSDEANVVTSRIARVVFHVPHVVARVYDPRKAEIYRRFGLQTISPITLGVARFSELLSFTSFQLETSLGTGEVGLVELEIPQQLSGRAVNSLVVPGEVMVVSITREGRTFIPGLNTVFQAGDFLHLAVASHSIDRIRALFE